MATKGSFYQGSTVYTETSPAGPVDAPMPVPAGNANSSFYKSGQVYAAIDLADSSVADVQAILDATVAAKETGFGLGFTLSGPALASSEWLGGHKFDVAVNFAANMAGSFAVAGVAATGSPVISLNKNGVQFCTITYSGGTGTFACSATSFAIGDLLELVAPSSVDATLAHLSITLFGTRP